VTKTRFHPVIAVTGFPEDGKYIARIGGWNILVCKVDNDFYALNDRCTHAASPLSTGRIRRGAVMCPLHGARFNIATGACIGGPYKALRRFELRIVEGQIEVAIPDEAPGTEDLAVSPA
jgi:nitrite reductase/ring-hydroxylating ferredoxin subunit